MVGSSTNPLLASFAIVLGLLIVMNLMSRVTLSLPPGPPLTPASSSGPRPRRATPSRRRHEALAAGAGHDCRIRPRWSRRFGARSADRTAIAAGAVLGVTAAVGAAAVRRAAGSLVALARRH